MGCMTVLNYPDQCMGGWGGSFRSPAGWGFTHINVIRGTPIDMMREEDLAILSLCIRMRGDN